MFDPHQRRIASKLYMWDRVRRGELMTLTIDLETSGLGRSGVPYATPGAAFITEYGDCLTDMAGNYLNSAQIFPKRPDWMLFQPAAPILQRVDDGPDLYDADKRTPYWQAMGSIVWRIEQAANAYDQFDDEASYIKGTYFYKHGGKLRRKTLAADQAKVIPVPMALPDGTVVHDVRWHPQCRKISYRVDHDEQSPFYESVTNQYYRDEKDGSLWKFVEPRIAIDFYNGDNYDIPVLRNELKRVGFAAADTTFLYSRGTPTNVQKPKNHKTDTRKLVQALALYGPQGEDGIKLGQLVDEKGRIRKSEALGSFLTENMRHANPIRLVKGGAFMPDDGSLPDLALAHGAMYDALMTAAARNLCWDVSPYFCSLYDKQADEKRLMQFFSQQTPKGDKLPVFSIPVNGRGEGPTETPYWFLGTDDQEGRFGRMKFLKVDGTFHKKGYHKLSVQEWVKLINETRRDPDAPVRIISKRKLPVSIPLGDVYQKSAQAGRYRANTDAIQTDCEYLLENLDMLEKISAAIEIIQRDQRFKRHRPQIPLQEDEHGDQYTDEVHYQEDAIRLERMEMRDRFGGSRRLPGIIETIKGGMSNVFKYSFREIDRGIERLAIKAHPVDNYKDFDLDDEIHEVDGYDEEKEIYENFRDLCERTLQQFKKKKWSYTAILREIKSPLTGRSYFRGNKFYAVSLRDMFEFRQALCKRIMDDYQIVQASDKPELRDYVNGIVDKNFAFQKEGKRRLLLLSDAYGGEKKGGGQPYVADEAGRRLEHKFLRAQNRAGRGQNAKGPDVRQILKRLVDKDKWLYKFYRRRRDLTVLKAAQRCVDLDRRDEIPASIKAMYDVDKYQRLDGMPNEDRTTDRLPTRRTMEWEIERLQLSASTRQPLLLERDTHSPLLAEASKMVQYGEGTRILSNTNAWLERSLQEEPPRLDLVAPGMHDPETGDPYDDIPYLITRNPRRRVENDPNFVVIDVPAWHLRYHVEQYDYRLPHRLVGLPPLSQDKIEAIEQGRPVVLREQETGRLYHTGPATFHRFTPKLSGFGDVQSKIRRDFERAGQPFGEKDVISALGIEQLYPVANSKKDMAQRAKYQSVKLPKMHVDGMLFADLANSDTTLTTAVVPLDYVPQQLKIGDPVFIRAMDTDMFCNIDGDTAPDTGHTYVAKLKHVYGMDKDGNKTGITLAEFNDMAKGGDIPAKVIKGAGFMGPDHVESRLNEWVLKKWKGEPLEQKVLVMVFEKVRKESWGYFNPPEAPWAAFAANGNRPAPSGYRDSWAKTKIKSGAAPL